jgi:hypothetical protein
MSDFNPPTLKKFRGSIKSCFIFIFLSGMAGVCIIQFFLHGFAHALRYWRIILSGLLFVGAPICILQALILVLLNPVAFSNEGIYDYSVLGKKRLLRWEDILEVRRFKLINLTWLRIYSKVNKSVLWLPLFQSKPTEFVREIAKFAPPNSPIRNHLSPGNT